MLLRNDKEQVVANGYPYLRVDGILGGSIKGLDVKMLLDPLENILCKASHNFFKLIKQNLTVKHLLGCSENAVNIYLWTAIISYLLLARVKALYKSPYSITEIGTLVKVYGLVKMDLGLLVTEPQPLIPNQDVNELTLF